MNLRLGQCTKHLSVKTDNYHNYRSFDARDKIFIVLALYCNTLFILHLYSGTECGRCLPSCSKRGKQKETQILLLSKHSFTDSVGTQVKALGNLSSHMQWQWHKTICLMSEKKCLCTAFYILLRFFAVSCKTTTSND